MILYGHHAPVVGAGVIQEELIAYRDAIHHVHEHPAPLRVPQEGAP